MWTELDRICLAAGERRQAEALWRERLGAEPVGEDTLPCWAAERTTLRVGRSEVAILEPDGVGLVADHLARRGPGILAVGFATRGLGLLRDRLDAVGAQYAAHGGQLFVAADRGVDLPGVHLVFSLSRARSRAGRLERLFGATYLFQDHKAGGETLAKLLDLSEPPRSVASPALATSATLVRLDGLRPDHLAFAMPWDPSSEVGRFFRRYGPRFHMVSAHAADLDAFEREWDHGPPLLRSRGAAFVHPSALGGVLMHVTDDPTRSLELGAVVDASPVPLEARGR